MFVYVWLFAWLWLRRTHRIKIAVHFPKVLRTLKSWVVHARFYKCISPPPGRGSLLSYNTFSEHSMGSSSFFSLETELFVGHASACGIHNVRNAMSSMMQRTAAVLVRASCYRPSTGICVQDENWKANRLNRIEWHASKLPSISDGRRLHGKIAMNVESTHAPDDDEMTTTNGQRKMFTDVLSIFVFIK